MAQTLEYNQAAVTAAALTVPSCDVYTENIRDLDDEPNDVGGLTAEELKTAFDRTGEQIVDYLNRELIPAIIAADATEEARAAAEAERVANEQERVANELSRVSAETARASAETARASAETARASAETARASAETARASAETARVSAETARVDETSGIVARSTAQANAAAGSASAASASAAAAQTWASRSPYIGDNGHWFVWDAAQGAFQDSGISAQGPQGPQGPSGPYNPSLIDNGYFVGGGSQQGGGQFPVNQRAGWIIKPGSKYYDSMWSGEHISAGYYPATYITTNAWSIVIDGTTYYATNGEATNVFPGYSGVGYGIDRWWWWNRTEYSLVQSGLRLNGDKYMAQKIAPSLSKSLLGQVVTMSCLTDTECIWKTFAWSEQTNGTLIGEGVEIRAGGSIPEFGINKPIFVINTATAPQTIKAVKLELGDTQTLAHKENGVWVLNKVPKYDEELRACQRYQVVLDSVAGSPIGTTVKPGSNGALIIPLPIVMRTSSPEYSVDGVFRATGDGFYADLPSTAFDNEWIRIVNGFCVIGLKIPVNNGCLVDTASTARLIIDANL